MPHRRGLCFVLPSLNGGGAERAAVQVLNGLSPDTWDRSMFLFERTGPYLADLDPAIDLQSASSPGRGDRWQSLRRFIQERRPEIVVAFLSYATALTAVRAAQTHTRVVFNQQTPMTAFLSDADYQWRQGWRRTVFTATSRLTYGAADLVIATSRGVADDLTENFGVNPDAVRVVPNPVDLVTVRAQAREPLETDQLNGDLPIIVAAGRLADAKNYPLLIDSMRLLRDSMPARLFILGQGELEPALRRQVADHGLEDTVTLLGFQRNPWKFIARADVFALSSHYEGFGNVLIEAMALGIPVVATSSAGTRDIVTHGVDGLLVGHAPEDMAQSLRQVLQNRDLRSAMAREAARSAERFAAPKVIAQYGAVLEQLAA